MPDFSTARLRANPAFELVPYDRLSAEDQLTLTRLTTRRDFYGILKPVIPAGKLSMKAVDRNTALLFQALQQPGPLPSYLARETDTNFIPALRELVLKEVLQVEINGRFLSGTAVYPLLSADGTTPAPNGFLPELSFAAVQYAARLGVMHADQLAARLYCYNRLPLSIGTGDELRSPAAIRTTLGIAPEMPVAKSLSSYQSNSSEDAPAPGWWIWRARQQATVRAPEGTYKLYVSPDRSATGIAFQETANVMARHHCSVFKVGCSAYGLLRPDKIVAYFPSRDLVEEASRELAARLQGCPVQGVPFSAQLTPDGLLSWGLDPPDHLRGGSESLGSWRRWITQRLAQLLLQSRGAGSVADRVSYTLERLRGEGVDVSNWSIDPRLWCPEEEAL